MWHVIWTPDAVCEVFRIAIDYLSRRPGLLSLSFFRDNMQRGGAFVIEVMAQFLAGKFTINKFRALHYAIQTMIKVGLLSATPS